MLNTESLLKVLELESKKGYEDKAVFGGLDKFLRNWAGKAVESLDNPKLLQRFRSLHLDKSDYASLTKEQRKQWVKVTLDFLTEIERRQGEGSRTSSVSTASRLSPSQGHHLSKDVPD